MIQFPSGRLGHRGIPPEVVRQDFENLLKLVVVFLLEMPYHNIRSYAVEWE